MVPNIEKERSNVFLIEINMPIMNEDMTMLEKRHDVLSKKRQEKDCYHRGELRNIDYWRPLEK